MKFIGASNNVKLLVVWLLEYQVCTSKNGKNYAYLWGRGQPTLHPLFLTMKLEHQYMRNSHGLSRPMQMQSCSYVRSTALSLRGWVRACTNLSVHGSCSTVDTVAKGQGCRFGADQPEQGGSNQQGKVWILEN